MASLMKTLFVVTFFTFSVVLWGSYGILLILLQLFKSPLSLFSKNDCPDVPSEAKDPSLGVHSRLVCDSQVSSTSSGTFFALFFVPLALDNASI